MSAERELEGDEDGELWTIFRDEVDRRAEVMAKSETTVDERNRALHALKGAAGMMGLGELAAVLKALHHAALVGDQQGFARAAEDLSPELESHGISSTRLSEGVRALRDSLPPAKPSEPARTSSPDLHAWFRDEARERLLSFDRAIERLAGVSDESGVRIEINDALRQVHAIKGGAGAVVLTEVARGAHALEGALAALGQRGRAPTEAELSVLVGARDELSRVLSGTDAEAGAGRIVASLRAEGSIRERDLPEARRSLESGRGAEVIRVATQALARLGESVGEVGLVHSRIERHAGEVQEAARALSRAARSVGEALRRIGPSRPWGVPAEVLRELGEVDVALTAGVRTLEREARGMRHDAEVLGVIAGDARDLIVGMGTTTAGWLFDRVVPTVSAMARSDAQVRVVRKGDRVEIGRAMAERMVEPMVQLLRNAVTHGVESASRRIAKGKPARATLRLEAESNGERLTLVVSDDGAGVDLVALRARLRARGLLSAAMSESEAEALAGLFLPGVSTRDTIDHTAGRGVGLDLVRQEVRGLRGEVRIETEPGRGTRFVIDLWPRSLVQRVLWLGAGGESVALPLAQVGRVTRARELPEGLRVRVLSDVLGVAPGGDCAWAVVLHSARGELALRVERVDGPGEIVVHPMPSPLGSVGPCSSVAVDGEGNVTLVLDADRIWDGSASVSGGL